MPTLHNPEDYDLYCVEVQQMVPAHGSIPITAEQAERVPTLVFHVTGEVQGPVVETSVPNPPAPAPQNTAAIAEQIAQAAEQQA